MKKPFCVILLLMTAILFCSSGDSDETVISGTILHAGFEGQTHLSWGANAEDVMEKMIAFLVSIDYLENDR
jgi:hypothetical protein